MGKKSAEVSAGTTTAIFREAARKETILEDWQKELCLRRVTQNGHKGGGGIMEREIEPIGVQPLNRMPGARPDLVEEDSFPRERCLAVTTGRDPWVTCKWHVGVLRRTMTTQPNFKPPLVVNNENAEKPAGSQLKIPPLRDAAAVLIPAVAHVLDKAVDREPAARVHSYLVGLVTSPVSEE